MRGKKAGTEMERLQQDLCARKLPELVDRWVTRDDVPSECKEAVLALYAKLDGKNAAEVLGEIQHCIAAERGRVAALRAEGRERYSVWLRPRALAAFLVLLAVAVALGGTGGFAVFVLSIFPLVFLLADMGVFIQL